MVLPSRAEDLVHRHVAHRLLARPEAAAHDAAHHLHPTKLVRVAARVHRKASRRRRAVILRHPVAVLKVLRERIDPEDRAGKPLTTWVATSPLSTRAIEVARRCCKVRAQLDHEHVVGGRRPPPVELARIAARRAGGS